MPETRKADPSESGGKRFYKLPDKLPEYPGLEINPYLRRLNLDFGPDLAYLINSEDLLEEKNIEPVFEFAAEDRARLRTEAGVAFANHPTDFDPSIVIRALIDGQRKIREDFLLLTEPGEFADLKPFFGAKHMKPAYPEKAKEIFKEVEDFINSGGLFIIFPSYKAERGNALLPKMEFQNGLAYLLERLDPDKMVYSFGINQQQAKRAGLHDGGKVEVSEAYSKAAEWQNVMSAAEGRTEKSVLLARHFVDTHPKNLSAYERA